MDRARLYEILDSLSKDRRIDADLTEILELLDLLEDENSEEINSWLDLRRKESLEIESPDSFILDEVLSRINTHIDARISTAESDGRKSSHVSFDKVRKYYGFFQKIAAVLFIPLFVIATYLLIVNKNNERSTLESVSQVIDNLIDTLSKDKLTTQEFVSPPGTRSKITLADSTEVWLNSASSLVVDNEYGKAIRRVKLLGQGFFNVRKNRAVPFIVEVSDKMKIRVTGTTFSVNAYPENDNIETVLISGSVKLMTQSQTIDLKPSERAVVDCQSNKLSISTVDNDKYRSWKDGVLIFNEAPMKEVLSVLEKWYNVKISVSDNVIMTYKFTARLDNCSMSQVLDYLSYSSPIKYSIKEKDVQLSIRE